MTPEAKSTSWSSRLASGAGRLLLSLAEWLWGDLNPAKSRRWAYLFWICSWPFLFKTRRVINDNLRVAFPEMTDEARHRLGRRTMLHFLGLGLDWVHILKHPGDCEKLLRLPPEFIRDCRAGNPHGRTPTAIYCTLHLGNWELQSRVSYVTGQPGAVVVARFRMSWFNELAERLRTSGAQDTAVIPAEGAARGVLRALLSGRMVGLLIDQNVSPRHGGIFCNFFGLPATASRLPAALARRLQVPIYVVACVKDDDGSFHMEYEKLPQNAWEYSSDEALTQAVFQAYEHLIRRYPEQYLWSYDRWRYVPANAPETLAKKYPSYATHRDYPCSEELFS